MRAQAQLSSWVYELVILLTHLATPLRVLLDFELLFWNLSNLPKIFMYWPWPTHFVDQSTKWQQIFIEGSQTNGYWLGWRTRELSCLPICVGCVTGERVKLSPHLCRICNWWEAPEDRSGGAGRWDGPRNTEFYTISCHTSPVIASHYCWLPRAAVRPGSADSGTGSTQTSTTPAGIHFVLYKVAKTFMPEPLLVEIAAHWSSHVILCTLSM